MHAKMREKRTKRILLVTHILYYRKANEHAGHLIVSELMYTYHQVTAHGLQLHQKEYAAVKFMFKRLL